MPCGLYAYRAMPLFLRLNQRSRNASTPQLVQLMISNLIFHCNNCDANRAFVTIRESTAAAQRGATSDYQFKIGDFAPTGAG